jgi:hypothetical protein
MRRLLGFNSYSVFFLLLIVFAISRFLHFDAEQLLPQAGAHYKQLGALTNTNLPDSVKSQISPELQAINEKGNCLGTIASVCVLPFYYGSKLIGGGTDLNAGILIGLELGALIFIALSIWFLRKFLLNFFDENYTAVFLLVIFLATPIFTSFSLNLLRPEIIELCCISAALVLLPEIQKRKQNRDVIFFALSTSLACLLNPAAIWLLPLVLFFNPLEANTAKIESVMVEFRKRLHFFKGSNTMLLLGAVGMLLVSYLVGINLSDNSEPLNQFDVFMQRVELLPQLLLSYRKGMLLYSPVLFLALVGLVLYFLESKFNALVLTLSFLLSLLTVLALGLWWTKTSFSVPELLGLIPVFIFPLNALINKCRTQGEIPSGVLSLALLFALFHTQFITWQIGNSVLKPHKLDQAYFNQVLFELKEPEELNFNRILSKGFLPQDKLQYSSQVLFKTDFTGETEYVIYDLNNPYHRVNKEIEYAYNRKIELLPGQFRKDALLEIKFRYRMSVSACNTGPFAVIDIESANNRYGYMNYFMESDASDHWRDFTGVYQLPEVKYSGDMLNFYIWNNGKCYVDVDNIQLTVYQPKTKSNSNDLFLIN